MFEYCTFSHSDFVIAIMCLAKWISNPEVVGSNPGSVNFLFFFLLFFLFIFLNT